MFVIDTEKTTMQLKYSIIRRVSALDSSCRCFIIRPCTRLYEHLDMYYSCMCTHTVSTKIPIKFASIRTFSSRSKAAASFPCRLAFFDFLFFSCLYMYTQNLMFVECNIHGSLDLSEKRNLDLTDNHHYLVFLLSSLHMETAYYLQTTISWH